MALPLIKWENRMKRFENRAVIDALKTLEMGYAGAELLVRRRHSKV